MDVIESEITFAKGKDMKSKITMLSIMALTCTLMGCFQGGKLSIDENDYQLTEYNRKHESKQFVGRGSLAGSRKTEHNDLIYLSNETKDTQVWIRLGYDSRLKYARNLSLHTRYSFDNWQEPGEASCIIKINNTVYDCTSGNINISREGFWTLIGNMVNAQARIRGDDDTENTQQINLNYQGELLRWSVGLLLPDEP